MTVARRWRGAGRPQDVQPAPKRKQRSMQNNTENRPDRHFEGPNADQRLRVRSCTYKAGLMSTANTRSTDYCLPSSVAVNWER